MTAAMAETHNQVSSDSDWRGSIMRRLVATYYRCYQYTICRDRKPWSITIEQLLKLPHESTDYQLGSFLQRNDFQFIPKFENHDLFHVLLGYGLSVEDEIRMQFCLAGSGRRTLSTLITIINGILLFPEHWQSFYAAYRRGLGFTNFSYQEFEEMLELPLAELRELSHISTQTLQ